MHFYNLAAYGTPQSSRKNAFSSLIPRYFEAEKKWKALVACHPNGIPFTTCFTSIKKLGLPEVGTLTAYLLTADLSYTEWVEQPSPEVLGELVHALNKGAFKGLQATSQISSGASKDEVREAFVGLYRWLEEELSLEERSSVTFDPVMVEHLLCKFGRLFPKSKKAKK